MTTLAEIAKMAETQCELWGWRRIIYIEVPTKEHPNQIAEVMMYKPPLVTLLLPEPMTLK